MVIIRTFAITSMVVTSVTIIRSIAFMEEVIIFAITIAIIIVAFT